MFVISSMVAAALLGSMASDYLGIGGVRYRVVFLKVYTHDLAYVQDQARPHMEYMPAPIGGEKTMRVVPVPVGPSLPEPPEPLFFRSPVEADTLSGLLERLGTMDLEWHQMKPLHHPRDWSYLPGNFPLVISNTEEEGPVFMSRLEVEIQRSDNNGDFKVETRWLPAELETIVHWFEAVYTPPETMFGQAR